MTMIKVYPGSSGIKEVYTLAIKQSELSIICLSKEYDKVIGDYFTQVFAPSVYGKIHTREILPDTKTNRIAIKNKLQSYNAVRLMKSAHGSESDLLLWENTVVFISFRQKSPMAIKITDPEIVASLRSQFEMLWSVL